MFTATEIVAKLNAEHPLPEVARSLERTTYSDVVIIVDDEGDIVKVAYIAAPSGPVGGGHALPLRADIVRQFTDDDDTWDSFCDEFEDRIAELAFNE